MPAARAASSRLIPSRALASASRRPLTRPSRSRRAIARSSAGVRPVAIATATMAQVPGLLSLPGQLAGRRPRSRLPVAGISAAILTLAGGILWMKDAGPIEVRTHKDELTNMFWVSLGGERYAFKYESHLRRLEIRSSSGSGDLLLEVSGETDPAAIVAFFRLPRPTVR